MSKHREVLELFLCSFPSFVLSVFAIDSVDRQIRLLNSFLEHNSSHDWMTQTMMQPTPYNNSTITQEAVLNIPVATNLTSLSFLYNDHAQEDQE